MRIDASNGALQPETGAALGEQLEVSCSGFANGFWVEIGIGIGIEVEDGSMRLTSVAAGAGFATESNREPRGPAPVANAEGDRHQL